MVVYDTLMEAVGNGDPLMCACDNREEGSRIRRIMREDALLYYVSGVGRK